MVWREACSLCGFDSLAYSPASLIYPLTQLDPGPSPTTTGVLKLAPSDAARSGNMLRIAQAALDLMAHLQEKQQARCSECGQPLAPQSSFCSKCGAAARGT